MELPLINDDFLLKNGHSFCNSRYKKPGKLCALCVLRLISQTIRNQGQLKCQKNGFDPRKIQISGRFHLNPAVSGAKTARNVDLMLPNVA